tara:strand:- start:173 stop:826 length:654 start_codon:yes stop_codon:yes gene_type:complete
MAKLTAPLLSMGAKGQIGKAMVIANWKGVDYARQYVKPANPRTVAQQSNRTRFALLREMYKLSPAVLLAPWKSFVEGRPLNAANKYVGENNRLLNGEVDMQNFIGSPGAKGGIPPESIAAAPNGTAAELEVTVEVPADIPEGWTVTGVAAAAFPDQDPTGIFAGPLRAGQVAAPGDTVTLDGLPNALCVATGWVIYTKANGDTAYSVALTTTATPAA